MKGILQLFGYVVFWSILIIITFGIGLIVYGVFAALTFVGASQRAEKLSVTLAGNLMPGEEIRAEAVQKRVFALWSRRSILAITSSRIIVIQRGLLGGFKMKDIQWKDLRDARIEQNVLPSFCGSSMEFRHLSSAIGEVSVDGLDQGIASTIYGRAQFEEQAWEEKRRVRAMEETRAAAGGVTVHSAPSIAPNVGTESANNMLDDLKRAKALLDDEAISDAEYQEMKSKILAR